MSERIPKGGSRSVSAVEAARVEPAPGRGVSRVQRRYGASHSPPGMRSPLQLRYGGRTRNAVSAAEPGQVSGLAEQGVRGASRVLPHREAIQASFGRHDVSGVGAHVGGEAAEASRAIGADAYATGNKVAFVSEPDLHTAAHEAAHVIQQRGGVQLRGGVGDVGDPYEQHADDVAALVVAGKSAESKLGDYAGGYARDTADTGQIQKKDAATAEKRSAVDPTWSKSEIRRIQKPLKKLGYYRLGVDGKLGDGTKAALVEVFGDDSWRTMSAKQVASKIGGVKKPKATGDSLHYGQMFRDGVLDISLGVGFDEDDNHLAAIKGFQTVLGAHGFKLDAAAAAKLYADAGRAVKASDFGQFYVKKRALLYTPPVGGKARPIHAVVRLLFSADGSSGGKAAAGFRQGLAQSDIAYYSGHGRYGSGPDFDRNMSFELLDSKGKVEKTIDDYTKLKKLLITEGKPRGRGAWAQFLWRHKHKRINVIGDNAGNVFLNPDNKHSGEFGAKLMYWNLKRQGKQGAPLQTGTKGNLPKQMASSSARDYRLVVFDGCRTQDYTKSIRKTPGVNKAKTDILATTRTVNWGDEVKTLAVFLDGILAQHNKAALIKDMDAKQGAKGTKGTYRDQ